MPARKKAKTKKASVPKPRKAAKTRVKKTEKKPKAKVKRTPGLSAKKKGPSKRSVKKKTAFKKPVARKKAQTGAPAGDRMQQLKKALITRREAIVKEAKAEIAKYMSGENRQLVDTALDEGDWAVVDISEDINLMRLSSHRKALHDIDDALRKIQEGTYGICEECGEEISEKRLSVIPTASFCLNCQGNKEQIEAIQREEQL